MPNDWLFVVLLIAAGAVLMALVLALLPSSFTGATVMDRLKGKRTHILVVIAIAVLAAEEFGLIPAGTALKIDAFLVPLGFSTLRMAIANGVKSATGDSGHAESR